MSRYHRLSIGQKQAESRARMREPMVGCPDCDTQVMPSAMLEHLARCTGPREPGPSAKWVTWREALAMGVHHATLSWWVRTGQVRHVGERQERRYLMRDLALRIAQRRGGRRRQSNELECAAGGGGAVDSSSEV